MHYANHMYGCSCSQNTLDYHSAQICHLENNPNHMPHTFNYASHRNKRLFTILYCLGEVNLIIWYFVFWLVTKPTCWQVSISHLFRRCLYSFAHEMFTASQTIHTMFQHHIVFVFLHLYERISQKLGPSTYCFVEKCPPPLSKSTHALETKL